MRGRSQPLAQRAAIGAAVALAGTLALTRGLPGQGVRGELRVRGDFLELQGLEVDSVAASGVAGDPLLRRLPDGTIALCVPNDFCRWRRSGADEWIRPVSQELRLVAWPGVRGVSARVHLRGRYASDGAWPRAEQEIDAISAYVSLDRSEFRVRAGRQFRASPLGYANFDGASFLWRAFRPVRIEAYGGWSLGIGLNGPRDGSLLEAADALAPDRRSLVYGLELGARLGHDISGSAEYRREIRTDRLALTSERLALSGRALLGRVSLDGAATLDLALGEIDEASLRADLPVGRTVRLTLRARHYVPFFELWTIWGAFSPVGFDEGEAIVSWRPIGPPWRIEVGGAYRGYGAPGAGTSFQRLRDDGWRAFATLAWSRGDWWAEGTYRAETGFGAARYGGDALVGRRLGSTGGLILRATSTRTLGEFRRGRQLATGGGAEGYLTVEPFELSAGIAAYRMTSGGRPALEDWTQVRMHAGLAYRFGTGMPSGAGRPPLGPGGREP
ncbi:MAG: hypothetical protein ACE5HF_06010 [Gemmatimonadota bacterium]